MKDSRLSEKLFLLVLGSKCFRDVLRGLHSDDLMSLSFFLAVCAFLSCLELLPGFIYLEVLRVARLPTRAGLKEYLTSCS